VKIFYQLDGAEIGPVELSELENLVDQGNVAVDTPVRREHLTVWQPFHEFLGIDADAEFTLADLLKAIKGFMDDMKNLGKAFDLLSGDLDGGGNPIKTAQTMYGAIAPSKNKTKLIRQGTALVQSVVTEESRQTWAETQNQEYGDVIAVAKGVILNGFPSYVPLNWMTEKLGEGPAGELVMHDDAVVLYDPSFGPGAWKTVITRSDLVAVKEIGSEGQGVQLKTRAYEARFDTDIKMGGRAYAALLTEWQIGLQECPQCKHKGPVVLRPGELTPLAIVLSILSCGFFFAMSFILSSLRKPVATCSACKNRLAVQLPG